MTRKEELKYIKKGKRMEILENILCGLLLILSYLIPFFYWFMK